MWQNSSLLVNGNILRVKVWVKGLVGRMLQSAPWAKQHCGFRSCWRGRMSVGRKTCKVCLAELLYLLCCVAHGIVLGPHKKLNTPCYLAILRVCPWNTNFNPQENNKQIYSLKQDFCVTVTLIDNRSLTLIYLWIDTVVCWCCLLAFTALPITPLASLSRVNTTSNYCSKLYLTSMCSLLLVFSHFFLVGMPRG